MKILKVRVKKQRTSTHCHYDYPNSWDSRKIHVLVYEEYPENMGSVEEDCLCVTDNETANRLLKESGVREVSEKEANVFGRKWKPSKTRMTGENEVIQIIRKLLSKPNVVDILRKFLTKKEFDSLDENKIEAGITKSRQFDVDEFIS